MDKAYTQIDSPGDNTAGISFDVYIAWFNSAQFSVISGFWQNYCSLNLAVGSV